MDNIAVSFTLDAQAIIAIIGIVVTLIVSIIGGAYAIMTNTKKYELTENYRQELLQWYSSVVELMTKLIHCCESEEFFDSNFSSQKIEMLAKLSALIEVGRFYFPNVIKNDGYGNEKPSAYQGYRHINLEFMLHFYQIASEAKDNRCVDSLWKLERNFTAVIFDMIEPRKRNHEYAKYLALTFPGGKAIEDFIYENPNNANIFKE